MSEFNYSNINVLFNDSQYLQKPGPLVCMGSGEKSAVVDCGICPICKQIVDIHNHKIAIHKGR
jgi:hypothetical protein